MKNKIPTNHRNNDSPSALVHQIKTGNKIRPSRTPNANADRGRIISKCSTHPNPTKTKNKSARVAVLRYRVGLPLVQPVCSTRFASTKRKTGPDEWSHREKTRGWFDVLLFV